MEEPSSISHRSEDQDDLINKLPSDVLVSILEKLELRDLVRVSVLSRRWRNLPHQLPRLALDIDDFLPDENRFYEDEGDDELELPADLPPDTLAQASEAMLEAMLALMASRRATGDHQQAYATTLAVSFLLRRSYLSIGRVLDDAMASGKASAIELTISTTYGINSYSNDMGHTISVQLAYGRRFRKVFDGCPAAFGGLTRLTMKDMRVQSSDFHDILSTCTRLKTLSLHTCDAGPRVSWRVQHARLAELTIDKCAFGGVDLVWLPRLERFTYRSRWVCPTRPLLSFGHVPHLTTVTLSHDQGIGEPTLRLSQILANTAVTDMRLNFKGQDIWVKPEGLKRLGNMFYNLKHIKIRNLHEECGLSWISFLLQASPCLQELHIKLWDHECEENEDDVYATKKTNVQWEVAAGFKHYGLTRVTILGLYNNTGEKVVAYIRHLVEAAVNLEEIQILRNTFCKECGGAGSGFPRTDQERDSLRRRISGGETIAFKICIQS